MLTQLIYFDGVFACDLDIVVLISLTQRFLSSPEHMSSKAAMTSSAPMVSLSIFFARSAEHVTMSSMRELAIPQRMKRVFSVILMLPSVVVSFKHLLMADLNCRPVAAEELFLFLFLLCCEDVGAIDLTGALPELFGTESKLMGVKIFEFLFARAGISGNWREV